MKLFNKMKAVMDERIIWFAYYKDEPIAMWINIPDLNEYFKHFNGKLGLIEKLRLLWMKKNHTCLQSLSPPWCIMGVLSFF